MVVCECWERLRCKFGWGAGGWKKGCFVVDKRVGRTAVLHEGVLSRVQREWGGRISVIAG